MEISEKQKRPPATVQQIPTRPAAAGIDVDVAEALIAEKKVGERIKRLRLKKSMGLVELGRQTGLSASFLSQLETGRVVPTLRNLSRIALVFGRDLNYFFLPDKEASVRISRANTRTRLLLQRGSGAIISESISALIPDRSVIPCIAEFPSEKQDVSFVPEVSAGEELVYVLGGRLLFVCSDSTQELGPGDALWVDAGATREYKSPSGENTRAMIITFATQGPGLPSARPRSLFRVPWLRSDAEGRTAAFREQLRGVPLQTRGSGKRRGKGTLASRHT